MNSNDHRSTFPHKNQITQESQVHVSLPTAGRFEFCQDENHLQPNAEF